MITRRLHWLGRSILFAGGSLAGLLLVGDTLSAQPSGVGIARQQATSAQVPAPSIRQYRNERGFRLPIQVDEKSRAKIREIQLYVKDQPTAPWKMCSIVGPDQQYFQYLAKRDGEYAFAMVTVDTKGRSVPADLRNEPPGIIVVIDTKPPLMELVNLGQSKQGQLIQFDVNDTNLNNARVGLSYQGGDRVFRPLEEVPGHTNVYCVPAQLVSTGVLRATAEDLARNITVREIHVRELPTPEAPATKPQPVASDSTPDTPESNPEPVAARPTPEAPAPKPQPVASEPRKQEELKDQPNVAPKKLPSDLMNTAPAIENGGRPTEQKPLAPPQMFEIVAEPKSPTQPEAIEIQKVGYRPDGSEGPRYTDSPLLQQLVGPVQEPALVQPVVTRKEIPKAQLVNQRKLLFDYQIEDVGQSGVGKVEVWVTRDEGKTWTKHCEDAARKNPIEVQFPEDGFYGVTLVVTNGRGKGHTPPVAGDVPDRIVEVDTAKPNAKIMNVQASFENSVASVQITWAAHDKNLGDAPVELFYGKTVEGPWLPIAKGLGSEGAHRWMPPDDVGSAFVRLMVRDQAGNTSAVGAVDPVVLDDAARPRGVIRAIRTEVSKQD